MYKRNEDVDNTNFNHVYGVRRDTNLEKLKIGNSQMFRFGKQNVVNTHTNKRNYRASGQKAGSRLGKYKKIIAPIVIRNIIMMEVTDTKKVTYIGTTPMSW